MTDQKHRQSSAPAFDRRGLLLHRWHSSVDRAGWAVAAGGGLCGVLAAVLAVTGGGASAGGALAMLMVGTVIGALGIMALGGPVWMVLHASGRRGPGYAAAAGAIIGFLVFTAAQTHLFGIAPSTPSDAATTLVRWISAIATGLLLALVAAAIALVMWRVAYRRIG